MTLSMSNPENAQPAVLIQSCSTCGTWFVARRERCPENPSHELADRPMSGCAVVFSFTVTHRPMRSTDAERVPFPTALVELAEGPHVLANVDARLHEISIGLAVRVIPDPDPQAPAGALLAVPPSENGVQHVRE
jgi:uncharacterized OB-fold protein